MNTRDKLESALTKYFTRLAGLSINIILGIYDLLVVLYRLTINIVDLLGLLIAPIILLLMLAWRAYMELFARAGTFLYSRWETRKQKRQVNPDEQPAETVEDESILTEWTAKEYVDVGVTT